MTICSRCPASPTRTIAAEIARPVLHAAETALQIALIAAAAAAGVAALAAVALIGFWPSRHLARALLRRWA